LQGTGHLEEAVDHPGIAPQLDLYTGFWQVLGVVFAFIA